MIAHHQDEEFSAQLIENLITQLAEVNTRREVRKILISVLTDKELLHAATRFEISKLIVLGHDHRKISALLGVGIATVTAVSKCIQHGKYAWISRGY